MLRHIVFWKFDDSCDKDANGAEIREALEGLNGKIPGLLNLQVRKVTRGSWDYSLYTEFTDAAAEEAYQQNPLHLACKSIVHRYLTDRTFVDYEV